MTLTLGSIMIEQNWRHQENDQRKGHGGHGRNNNCSPIHSSPSNNNHHDYSTSTNTNSTMCSGHRGHGHIGRSGEEPVVVKLVTQAMGHDGNSGVSDESSQEFLPICDALFNVISLGAYFCDIVFDVLIAYTFYHQGLTEWCALAMTFICLSLILSQLMSFRWYRGNVKRGQEPPSTFLIPIHLALAGVLWRYFKLFIPVDLRFIKSEVRDLCLLRLVHGFCQAAPMLLIQVTLICKKNSAADISDLDIVSTSLSLFSVCWALASYSKNIRRQNVHKLVLTWLGVIFQFVWRLGTITSRVVALAIYATIYHHWLFLVLILHWFSMFLWLISPTKNNGPFAFDGEKMRKYKKIGYAAVIAVVYTFCFINVGDETYPSRPKVIIFYVTMFLENSLLLLSVWLIAAPARNDNENYYWFRDLSISLVFGAFVGGIGFMCLYYRYFHVKKLSYGGGQTSSASINGGSRTSQISNLPSQISPGFEKSENFRAIPAISNENSKIPARGRTALYNRINAAHHLHHHPNVPGVFNCRFNPAIKRKKKKPSSFVPVNPVNNLGGDGNIGNNGQSELSRPFWKRPLSLALATSENESVRGGGGVQVHNIQQKLYAKKQQQLADLAEIEEEIKQGKLRRPHISELPEPVQYAIPFGKKQPWFGSDPPAHAQLSPRPPILIPPPGGELVLDPHFLASAMSPPATPSYSPSGFYDAPEWNMDCNSYFDEPLYQNDRLRGQGHGHHSHGHGQGHNHEISKEDLCKSYRHRLGMTSDVESQLSIPRSFTLPREFKYKRKSRKIVKTEHFLPSTNSSDGDVDSAEDGPDPELYNDQLLHQLQHPFPLPNPNPVYHHVHVSSSGHHQGGGGRRKHNPRHETKL